MTASLASSSRERLHNKKIIVFGTNQNSDILFRNNMYPVSYIIDNDSTKWGSLFYERTICNPSRLTEEDLSTTYVILTFAPSGATYQQVADQLTQLGLQEGVHFTSMYYVLPDHFAYEEIRPLSNYAPWKSDTSFQDIYQIVKSNTMVDIYRCYELWSLVEQVSSLEGALLEIGVWKGGTGALIARKAQLCKIDSPVYLCDTFSGVVKTSHQDNVYRGGEHSDTSEEIVRELVFNQLKLHNINIITGIFPDETNHLIDHSQIRFCHIDVDAFLSARDIFEWVWDRLVVGGVIVFDDYGFMTCEGITRYVNQLKTESRLMFVHNINGHAVIIKRFQ